jgi:hypothetical protein
VWDGSAACPIIPQADWVESDLSHAVKRIGDQDGKNWCHSYAGAGALMAARFLAGHADTPLSAPSLAIAVTGGANVGAGLDEVLHAITTAGVAPIWVVGDGFSPRADAEAARQYRVNEWFDCGHQDVIQAISSALQLGFVCPFGWSYHGGGGHAQVAVGLRKLPGNNWGWLILNSWKASFGGGQDGFGRPIPAGMEVQPIDNLPGIVSFGGWAIRCSSPSADDPTPPAPRGI